MCLSDESVSSFAKFIRTQKLEKLHLSHRAEEIRLFDKTIVADFPAKIKDASMGELNKAVSENSAPQSLTYLHLAHLKLHS